MAACSPQALLDDSAGFASLPPGMLDLAKTALLCRIAQALGMTCDVQSLLNDAACFACLPPGTLAIIQTQLLCQIAGGISSAGCVASTNGDPEGVLSSPCSPALAVDPNTKAIYLFTGVAGTKTGWELKV